MHSVSVVNGIMRILPVLRMGNNLSAEEFWFQAELLKRYEFKSTPVSRISAIDGFEGLVRRLAVQTGARQRVDVIHHQGDIILSKLIER